MDQRQRAADELRTTADPAVLRRPDERRLPDVDQRRVADSLRLRRRVQHGAAVCRAPLDPDGVNADRDRERRNRGPRHRGPRRSHLRRRDDHRPRPRRHVGRRRRLPDGLPTGDAGHAARLRRIRSRRVTGLEHGDVPQHGRASGSDRDHRMEFASPPHLCHGLDGARREQQPEDLRNQHPRGRKPTAGHPLAHPRRDGPGDRGSRQRPGPAGHHVGPAPTGDVRAASSQRRHRRR